MSMVAVDVGGLWGREMVQQEAECISRLGEKARLVLFRGKVVNLYIMARHLNSKSREVRQTIHRGSAASWPAQNIGM